MSIMFNFPNNLSDWNFDMKRNTPRVYVQLVPFQCVWIECNIHYIANSNIMFTHTQTPIQIWNSNTFRPGYAAHKTLPYFIHFHCIYCQSSEKVKLFIRTHTHTLIDSNAKNRYLMLEHHRTKEAKSIWNICYRI